MIGVLVSKVIDIFLVSVTHGIYFHKGATTCDFRGGGGGKGEAGIFWK